MMPVTPAPEQVNSFRQLLLDEWRFLTFRRMSPAVRDHWQAFLVFGLIFTWLAGVGRYWDNPRAHLWQFLGLGSIVYAFVLALIIWALIAPLKPRHWSYRNVLVFVTLTAPPALLYAVPVEKFISSRGAIVANMWFLAIVAGWRVALYAMFLRKTAGLSGARVIVGVLLPLSIIVVTLMALNLEHVVFNLMGGLRETDRSVNDGAYSIVIWLSLLSIIIAPIVVLAYAVLVFGAWRSSRRGVPAGDPHEAGG